MSKKKFQPKESKENKMSWKKDDKKSDKKSGKSSGGKGKKCS
jgi:hypothetical protein